MSKPVKNSISRLPEKWFALFGIGMGVFMSTLDVSIVNISLPTLIETFDTDFATIQWVILSYALVITSLMLSTARLGDMKDKKKLYQIGLVLFTLGSLLCGLSPSISFLIASRAFQGLGATIMQALGMAIVTEIFPSSERGRALGIMSGIVSVGIASGPPIGGLLIGLINWHAIFLVNVPVGILAGIVVWKFVPHSKPKDTRQHFDPLGAAMVLFMLFCYALAMTLGQNTSFTAPATLILLSIAAVCFITFLLVEPRQKQPMIDFSLFRNILFSINLVMAFLVFVALSGLFIIPFYLELVLGYPTELVGLLMMVEPVMMGLAAPFAGSLSDKFGSRLISIIGLLLITLGCLMISTFHENMSAFDFAIRMIPFGIGLGTFQSPNNSAIMGAAPRERLGIASGLLSLSRNLAQTSGLPLIGALFSSLVLTFASLPAHTDTSRAPAAALVYGISGTFRICALIIFSATCLAVLALWLDHRIKNASLSKSDTI